MQLIETLAHLFHPRRSNNHRPVVLHPSGFFSFAAIALVFALSVHATSPLFQEAGVVLGFSSSITASQVVVQTNQERSKLSLPPLTVNSRLNAAALAKAQNMFSKQYWAHVGPDGTQPWKFFKDSGYSYNAAGENLARDFSTTPDMVAAWIASPTHRANIVNPRFREIGVAVLNGKLLGTDTTLVVQLFGQPRAVAARISDAGAVKGVEDVGAVPAVIPEQQAFYDNKVIADTGSKQKPESNVLGGTSLPITTFALPPLFSPIQLIKAFFLAVILLIVLTLVYDAAIMSNKNIVRIVGKNMAHILLLGVVAFLLVFFKGGIVR